MQIEKKTFENLEIDCSRRPLWNPKTGLSVKDEFDASVLISIQNNSFIKFKHLKALSHYETKCDVSKFNQGNLLMYFDGTRTITEICESIKKLQPGIDSKQVYDRIHTLYSKGFITLK